MSHFSSRLTWFCGSRFLLPEPLQRDKVHNNFWSLSLTWGHLSETLRDVPKHETEIELTNDWKQPNCKRSMIQVIKQSTRFGECHNSYYGTQVFTEQVTIVTLAVRRTLMAMSTRPISIVPLLHLCLFSDFHLLQIHIRRSIQKFKHIQFSNFTTRWSDHTNKL